MFKETDEVLLRKALLSLKALGARYVVRIGDERYQSELPVEDEKPKRTRVVDPNRVQNGPYLIKLLEDMEPDTVRTVAMQEGDTFDRFASNVGAYCHGHFTPKGFTGKGYGVYYAMERNPEENTITVFRFK